MQYLDKYILQNIKQKSKYFKRKIAQAKYFTERNLSNINMSLNQQMSLLPQYLTRLDMIYQSQIIGDYKKKCIQVWNNLRVNK